MTDEIDTPEHSSFIDKIGWFINRFRIVPRILILGAAYFFGWYSWEVTEWYMLLVERSAEESGFAAATITLLGGVFKFMFDKYVETGRTD